MKIFICNSKLVLTFLVLILFSVPAAFAQTNAQIAHAHFKTSLEHLMNGDYQDAIHCSNQALRLTPNFALSYMVRARAYYELKDYEKAISDCDNVIRLDKLNASAFSIRGNAHSKTGNTTNAISDWEAALKLNPNLDEVKSNLELARVSVQTVRN